MKRRTDKLYKKQEDLNTADACLNPLATNGADEGT